jgi:hypothetical protein
VRGQLGVGTIRLADLPELRRHPPGDLRPNRGAAGRSSRYTRGAQVQVSVLS